MNFLKGILLFSFLGFSAMVLAQDKALNKIEMWYDQGVYSKVERKSSKLELSPKYKDNLAPSLFKILAQYQLSKTGSKFNASSAIYDYEQLIKRDADGSFRKRYHIYIHDLKMAIADEIRELNQTGKKEEARIRYNSYHRLFKESASFEDLSKVKPEGKPATPIAPKSSIREQVVDYANEFIGVQYVYGGMSEKGFDCSGFTQYVMAANDLSIPRTASAQGSSLEKINLNEAKKGDLVFFGSSSKHVSHVGIVVSDKGEPLKMIHASSSKGIMISPVNSDPYWSPKLLFARRVINQ